MKNITELLKGILEGCILELIGQQETYGYDLTQKLRALGFEDVVEGTVYTITTRLEKSGLVEVEKRDSAIGPPRKFYRLNEAGQQRRNEFWESWFFLTDRCGELYQRGHEHEPV